MSKQSSVDYMLSWIESNCLFHFEDKKKLREVCERAKAMHQKEIEKAFREGFATLEWDKTECNKSLKYYNETFHNGEETIKR